MEDVMNQEQQVKEEETITVDVEDSEEKLKAKEEPEQLLESSDESESPFEASLNSFIPCPSPRISSGILRPPKRSTTTRRIKIICGIPGLILRNIYCEVLKCRPNFYNRMLSINLTPSTSAAIMMCVQDSAKSDLL